MGVDENPSGQAAEVRHRGEQSGDGRAAMVRARAETGDVGSVLSGGAERGTAETNRGSVRGHVGALSAGHRTMVSEAPDRILHYNHGRVHMSLGPGIPAPLNPITAPLRASTPASAGPPSALQSRVGWIAPRVLVGKGRRMSSDVVIAQPHGPEQKMRVSHRGQAL